MNSDKSARKNLYYSKDHEWIDFRGTVAYVGVSSFKLTGFKEVQQVIFNGSIGFKKKGDVIAAIKYNDYQVEVHMPVDGKVLEMNTNLVYGDLNVLLKGSEEAAWVALVSPSQPYERKDLLLPKQYQMNGKSKYVK